MNSNIEEQKTEQFKPYKPEKEKESTLRQWLEEGSQNLDKKEYNEAIKLFEKVLRVDPENIVAYEKLSIARSIQADRNRVEDYLAMGYELMKQFDWSGAYDEFQAVLSIDPDNEDAQSCLNEVRMNLQTDGLSHGSEEDKESGEEGGSAEELEFNIDSEPEMDIYYSSTPPDQKPDSEFQTKLEEALRVYENGFLSRAKELLEDLQKRDPEHAQVQFYLTAIDRRIEIESTRKEQIDTEEMFKKGMDCLERQDFEGARNLFTKILGIRPDFQQAKLMLNKIDVFKGSVDTQREKFHVTSGEENKKADQSPSTIDRKRVPMPIKKAGLSTVSKVFLFVIPALAIIGAAAASFYLIYIFPKSRYENSMNTAQELDEMGKSVAAIPWIEKALNARPDSIDALTMLGQVFLKTGKLDEAVRTVESALDKYPENKTLVWMLAQAHLTRQDWVQAERYYKIVQTDPRFHDEAVVNIAVSQKNRGLLDDAIEMLEEFLMQNDQNAKGYYYLAQCYQEKNDKESAEKIEEAYLKAIESDSEFIEAYEDLAELYYNRRELDKGIETLEKLLGWFKPATLEKSKRVATIRFILGEMQYEAGRFTDAIDNFSEVIQIEPSVEAYRSLGKSHYKMDRLTEAILMWRRGLNMNSADDDLWWQIGVAQYRQGDLIAAENSYKEALRHNPNHVRALTNLGYIYYQQYNYKLARKYWKQSLELDSDQPLIKQELKKIDR